MSLKSLCWAFSRVGYVFGCLDQSCSHVFSCGVDVCRLSLTCLRFHREVWLSLQYTVHQPGAVSVGGVISICSCHLHHWRTCGGETATWHTKSRESTSVLWFRNDWTKRQVSLRLCHFTCLHRTEFKKLSPLFFFCRAAEVHQRRRPLLCYFSKFHHCQGKKTPPKKPSLSNDFHVLSIALLQCLDGVLPTTDLWNTFNIHQIIWKNDGLHAHQTWQFVNVQFPADSSNLLRLNLS